MRRCYEGVGFTQDPTTATAPRFDEFWRVLLKEAETSKDVRKITTRLESIFHLGLFGDEHDGLFSLDGLLLHTAVLDLHGLEIEENQRVAASFFLQRLYREMFNHPETAGLRNAIVFDEAHRVARLKLIPKMMQECRKYGILFIVSSQRVEDFDRGVLDSSGNHVYLRVNHPDARRLAAYLATNAASEVTKRLQSLHKYNALFRSEEHQPFVHVALIGTE